MSRAWALVSLLGASSAALLFCVEGPVLAQSAPGLDQALLPLFSQLPSDEDLTKVKAAATAIDAGDGPTAEAAAADIVDPLARKLVRWWELRSNKLKSAPQDTQAFIAKNPGWPNITLRARAEESLLTDGEPQQIVAFFHGAKPETPAGAAALAVGLLGKGDLASATALASDAWRTGEMSDAAEAAVLDRLGRLLTPADQKFRADRLLYAPTEYESLRTVREDSIKRLVPHMTPADQAKIEARLAVYRCGRRAECLSNAGTLFARLPEEANKDRGVIFAKAQMLRKTGDAQGAWRLMLQTGATSKAITSPDDWWLEERVSAYAALYDGDHQAAYRLAAEHGALSVNPLKDAEFLAGWIALRFLKDPKRALTHFKTMRQAADGPMSLSQADYWLGRAFAQLGDQRSAKPAFVEAASFFNTYYGQIARQTLDKSATNLAIAPIPVPPEEHIRRFVSDDSVRAAVIAGKAGLVDAMRVLLNNQKDRARDEASAVLAAHLAITLGDTQTALKIGKSALENGWNGLTRYSYPVVAMPAFEPLRPLPELALLLGIARQESEFNTLTKSNAGARGILQILPGTAKGVCAKYKVRCELSRLVSDPAYNAKLASAYVADTTDDFSGSYIMAIAGYNAGPGRVKEWIGKIGDPRDAGVDPIDWVEMLNLDETRDYVKKVLSNVEVYRAEIEGPANALRIRADLDRARASPLSDAAN
jgi:soluble lytic murein transglycosylase